VSKYLQTLVNLQIARKLYPFGENPQNGRPGKYADMWAAQAKWYE
jgi:hypothetical protein